MEWIVALVIVLPITYVVLMIAHYLVLTFIVKMGWDETDWFHNVVNKENKK